MAGWVAAAKRVLYPKLEKFAKPKVETRTDAAPDDDIDEDAVDEALLDDTMGALHSATTSAFSEGEVKKASQTTVARTTRHSETEFARLGIKVKKEPKLGSLIAGWTKDNVARIKGMQDDQLGKIERLLREGHGMRYETLADRIAEQVEEITQSRAEAIARDQVLTLNGQITRERQTAAGIEQFVWTTSQDERVREEHEDLEGETFDWDDPPDVGVPGEDYNCRCTAFAVLPELDDEASADEAAE